MRYLLCGLAALLLAGCGDYEDPPVGVPGFHVDITLATSWEAEFEAAQDCAGLHVGDFWSLSVSAMSQNFPCQWYTAGCAGEFRAPNIIMVGSGTRGIFAHEALHYLMLLAFGDPDPGHARPEWMVCKEAGVVAGV